MEYKIIWITL